MIIKHKKSSYKTQKNPEPFDSGFLMLGKEPTLADINNSYNSRRSGS
jgi:hypothetical protein